MELPLKSDLDGKLSVFAEMTTDVSDDRGNPLRVTSDPATLRLIRDPSVPKEAPRLHVLSIGVGDHPPHSGFEKYDHLTHCGADANEIADIFWSQRGKDGVFRSDDQLKKVVLAEKEATTGNIRRELRALADKANANDVAIIFFAGHGIIDDQFGYYLGTYDAQTQDPSHTALGGVELGELLDGIKARTLLILETCQAGGAFGSNKRVNSPSDLTGLINHLSSAEQGTIIIAASGDEEKSFEDPKSGGFLKTAIVEHLKSGGGELVSCGDLQRQVMKDVPKILAGTGTKSAGVLPFAKEGTKDQHPYCVMPEAVEDFPIAKRRTETGR